MKTRSLLSHAILSCSLVLVFHSFVLARLTTSQEKNPTIQVPEAEAKAVKDIEAAKDLNAKWVGAEAFLKKYPASKARPQLAGYMASKVYGVTDANQRITAAQKYLAVFTDPTDAKLVQPALIDAYVTLSKVDEAFQSGAAYLANDAGDVEVRVLLAMAGAEQARGQNLKHMKVSREYGMKAIELLEADKKPAAMDSATWLKQKAMLPALHQQMGVLWLIEQKAD